MKRGGGEQRSLVAKNAQHVYMYTHTYTLQWANANTSHLLKFLIALDDAGTMHKSIQVNLASAEKKYRREFQRKTLLNVHANYLSAM